MCDSAMNKARKTIETHLTDYNTAAGNMRGAAKPWRINRQMNRMKWTKAKVEETVLKDAEEMLVNAGTAIIEEQTRQGTAQSTMSGRGTQRDTHSNSMSRVGFTQRDLNTVLEAFRLGLDCGTKGKGYCK
jgi:hypothetical protein